jgi:hypothetical protein
VLKFSTLPDRYQALLRRLQASFRTRRWHWIVGISAFLIINGYILYRLSREWPAIADFGWMQSDPRYLAAAAAVQFCGLLVAIWGWSFVMRRSGGALRFLRHFKAYTLGNLARKLPGGIGVDLLSRIYVYDQHGVDRVAVSFATLIEPLIMAVAATIVLLMTLLAVGGAGVPVNPLIPLAVLVCFLVLIPTPLFGKLLARVSRVAPEQQQLRWYHLLIWVLVNVVTITLGGLTLFLVCRAFGVVNNGAVATLIQYWALVIVSSLLVAWLPFDIGASNSVTVLILATLMPMPQALAMLVVWRLWNTLSEMVWGAIGFAL